jgi:hypothetical protein
MLCKFKDNCIAKFDGSFFFYIKFDNKNNLLLIKKCIFEEVENVKKFNSNFPKCFPSRYRV